MTEAPKLAIDKCELTPQQRQQWADTMSMMAWTAPGFQHILYKRLVNHDGEYLCVPTRQFPNAAATDARNIMVNPDKFFNYKLKERVFITAHEVVHNMFGDVEFLNQCARTGSVPMSDGTTVPFRNDTMQRAMDYRINAILRDSRIGDVPSDALLDDEIAKAETPLLDVYKKLYEDDDGEGEGKSGKGQSGFDTLAPPGQSLGQNPQAAASQRNPQQWSLDIAAARRLEELRSKGSMPGSLRHMFEEMLNPKVPWTDFIRTLINRATGSGGYDWSRADDEYIVHDRFEPSPTGKGAGWIVVWCDTSGSIAEAELNKYLGELAGILEDTKPTRVTVVWCDAAIHDTHEVTDASDLVDIKCNGLTGGGGGTSVEPVLDWIKDQTEQPELFIGFTDGYVDFPDTEPHYPVIWASVSDKKDYPFGEVVGIE